MRYFALFALVLAGCAARSGGEPLTPREREQAIRAAQAAEVRRGLRPTRCGTASDMAQLNARQSTYSGADAFDSRGCVRTNATNIAPP